MKIKLLNYCFSKDMVKLPIRFNFLVRNRAETDVHEKNKICHYVAKTLHLDRNDPFNRLWFSYFKKTPWFNEDTITHFYEELIKHEAEQKNFAIQISALMSGKSRAFFTERMNLNFLINVFRLQEGEEIISAVNQESVQVLKESMKASAGKKVYFILISGYEILRAELMKEGFVEGRDFINAVQFLSSANGIPMNVFYENLLIKAL